MATLKEISVRLRSVKNIQKITKSMKMVSAAKYARAERELRPARAYGEGASALYEKAELQVDEQKPNHLMVLMSSDRGLCGGIHSSLTKAAKAAISEQPSNVNTMIIPCGDKARTILQKTHGENILFHVSELGKKPPVFADSSAIAQEILDSGFEFDVGKMIYNKFNSVVSYETLTKPVFSFEALNNAESLSIYDDVDADIMQNYQEFSLASMLFFGMKEQACSEQSARMTAMDGASKNAGEMIDKLTLTFNRTRQAVITRELIEIISGAAALD